MAPTPGMPAETNPPVDAAFDRELTALRERLRAARAERGACPPWEELRDDLLPGGGNRAGRTERLAHRDLCPYCDSHVQEWARSADRTADALGAIEKGVARGVVAGARKLVGLGGAAAPRPSAPPPAAEPPAPLPPPPVVELPAPAPTPSPAPRASTPYLPPRMREPASAPTAPREPIPAPSPASRAPARPAAVPSGPLRLLVVEIEHEHAIPQSVFLCAAVLEAEVAAVPRIEAMGGDPDLDAVCGVVFVGGREPADWPAAVRRARDLVPGRPVVVIAGPGEEPSGGARRTLGAALVSSADPAERLLLALDARLR